MIYKMGIEVEYNPNEEGGFVGDTEFIQRGYTETCRIEECVLKPYIIEDYWDYIFPHIEINDEHPEGEYDDHSGSLHTHLSFDVEYIYTKCNVEDFNIFAVLLPFMCRRINGNKMHFRSALYNRAKLCPIFFSVDSKELWLTFKQEHCGIEVRINETIPIWVSLVDVIFYECEYDVDLRSKLLEFSNEVLKYYGRTLGSKDRYYWNEKGVDLDFEYFLNKFEVVGTDWFYFIESYIPMRYNSVIGNYLNAIKDGDAKPSIIKSLIEEHM